MKKKYQVFVSSTYKDLKEERRAVMQCLLEMNCIPVGMEQFPASGMNQMDYIRMMLDDCDYYVLILAGRYGSLDTDGIGFTEKEYDYAISQNIPIMSFVVEDVGKLPSEKCESKAAFRKKLEAFRKKVCQSKMVKFYSSPDSLTTAVAVSLNRCIQDYPAVGWIRGDSIDSTEDIEEKIEKYLEKHTMTESEIDALFDNKAPVSDDENVTGKIDTASADGVITVVEELMKKLPSVSVGTPASAKYKKKFTAVRKRHLDPPEW